MTLHSKKNIFPWKLDKIYVHSATIYTNLSNFRGFKFLVKIFIYLITIAPFSMLVKG